MIGPGVGQARDHHVGIAHGLDLLEAEPVGEEVEGTEDLVEDTDDALGSGALGERREVDDVGEHNRHVRVALGNDPGLALESLGDRPSAGR